MDTKTKRRSKKIKLKIVGKRKREIEFSIQGIYNDLFCTLTPSIILKFMKKK